MYKHFRKNDNTDNISSWKSKRLSEKVIKPPNDILAQELNCSDKNVFKV